MKILYLIYHAGNGGSENYVFDMCNEMIKRGHTPLLGYCVEGKLVKDLKSAGVECLQIDMPSWYHLQAVVKLKRIVKEKNISIIHTQFSRENYLACFAKLFVPYIKIVYTSHVINCDSKMKSMINFLISFFNDKIIAVSAAVKTDLIQSGYRKEKIALIYNGLDFSTCKEAGTTAFGVSEDLSRAVVRNMIFVTDLSEIKKSHHKIENDDVLLVNVSRFSPEKGIPYLLEQFKKANSINSKIKLVLVGDGKEKEGILLKIKELNLENHVFLLGYRNDTLDILFGCDIYISSSSTESLGYSILEAMLCHKPIIATDVGGCPELVNSESNCGFLVDYGSDEMHKKILELAQEEDYRTILGENAHGYVKRYFDREIMMDRTMKIYESGN